MRECPFLAAALMPTAAAGPHAEPVGQALTPKLRDTLRTGIQQVLGASRDILAALVTGDHATVAARPQKIHDSFILEQALNEQDKKDLEMAVAQAKDAAREAAAALARQRVQRAMRLRRIPDRSGSSPTSRAAAPCLLRAGSGPFGCRRALRKAVGTSRAEELQMPACKVMHDVTMITVLSLDIERGGFMMRLAAATVACLLALGTSAADRQRRQPVQRSRHIPGRQLRHLRPPPVT